MESEAAISMDREANKPAVKKGDEEFGFHKMKEVDEKFRNEFKSNEMDTMIYRFPPGLGEGISSRYPSMVVPRFVAIGPYHHGKKHLKKMEEVKKVAVYYLSQRIGSSPETMRKAVVARVKEARGKYIADDEAAMEEAGMMKMKDDAQFAVMMLCDACFLLLYMDAYNRSCNQVEDHKEDPYPSMRRFLFSNRDSINNDMMLLENQLPWLVIQAVLGVAVVSPEHEDMHATVGDFIVAMGNSFMILESTSELVPYKWDDNKKPPAHLLGLLRCYKTEKPADKKTQHNADDATTTTTTEESVAANHTAVVLQLHDDDGNNNNHPLIQSPPPPAAAGNNPRRRPQAVTSISAISPMDLEEIGIQLTASQSAAFSDMGLEKAGPILSRLTMAPLSLSGTRASWLVNMAALEVCTTSRYGDPADRTAVCSYLALLAFFMAGTAEVRGLRSKGLLHGLHSDDDMLAFFKTVVEHLPDCGKQFAFVMAAIEEYKRNRYIMTTLYRWVYRNWKTIGTVVSIIVGLIGLYKALFSLVHRN